MAKKVTIKDIANLTGVSVTTVSNVINGNSHKTSQKTIDKINKVIEELNYIPNFSARSLVKKQSKLIGVIIPQTEAENQVILENPFYSELVSGIEAKLREKGYYMMLTGIDTNKSYLDVFVNWNLDGAILLGAYKEKFYEKLKKINVPILLVDSYIDDDFYHNIGIDDEHGGYLATKYLIDAGHKDIGLVTGKIRHDGVEEKRFFGYKRALNEAGIDYREERVFHGHVDYDYGVEAGQLISEITSEVSAVFATADVLAAGIITGLYNNGISVPDQISIIGFDNIPISKMIVPSLTTVDQGIYEKGVKSIETLIKVIETKDKSMENSKDKNVTEDLLMPLSIVERKSVKRLN